MSGLITQENPISTFGEFLPVPQIEKIYAHADYLQLQLAIYLRIGEEESVTEAQDALSDLNIYIAATASEELFTAIQQQTVSIFDLLIGAGDSRLYEIVKFSQFEETGEGLYDAEGYRVGKYITTVEFLSESRYLRTVWNDWFWSAEVSDYYIMSISCVINEDENGDFVKPPGNVELLNKQKSDIAYDIVKRNGVLVAGAEVAYIDEGGNVYAEIPLQLAGGTYHKVESLSRSEIVDYFNELVSEYTTTAETNDSLQSVINSVLYVLATYEEDAQLLVKLNQVVNAFPSKTSADTIGALYERMKERQLTVNTTLAVDPVVNKKLIRNSKIIDKRGEEGDTAERVPPSPPTYTDEEVIYPTLSIGVETWEDYEIARIYGFFFIDYEKLVAAMSTLATIFAVPKIQTYFGISLTNQAYLLTSLKVTRLQGIESSGVMATFEADVKNSGGYPQIDTIEHTISPLNDSSTVAYATVSIGDTGGTGTSLIALRGFNLANSLGLNGYRLMGFEIEDYLDSTHVHSNIQNMYYTITANFEDRTGQIITALVDNYSTLKDGALAEYVEAAAQFCNFNEVDNEFNAFFANNIEASYGDLSQAPWYQAPVLYCIHQDLLADTYGGDSNLMLEDARLISDKINPRTGTLDELTAFQDNFTALYDNFYSGDSELVYILDEIRAVDDYTIDRSYTSTTDFLPLPYVTEPPPPEPYEGDVWNYYTSWSTDAHQGENTITTDELEDTIRSLCQDIVDAHPEQDGFTSYAPNMYLWMIYNALAFTHNIGDVEVDLTVEGVSFGLLVGSADQIFSSMVQINNSLPGSSELFPSSAISDTKEALRYAFPNDQNNYVGDQTPLDIQSIVADYFQPGEPQEEDKNWFATIVAGATAVATVVAGAVAWPVTVVAAVITILTATSD